MKSDKSGSGMTRAFLTLAGGSLMLLGCIIPDKSATAPNVAPGSAASIGGGASAPARRRRRAWRWGRTAVRTR